jgi:SAM-dependent methyltransferase
MGDMPNVEYLRQIMHTQRNRVAASGKIEPFLRIARKQSHLGTSHFCPVCESPLREFVSAGNPLKTNRRCPVCGSLERHRLVWLFLYEKTNLFALPRKRLLHLAPELCLASMLQDRPTIDYVSTDLTRCAMVQTDFTRLCFRDEMFDAVYASYVLEHIVDDRTAIREVYRTLKPDGWAILQVPVKKGKATYEDANIRDPEQREQIFGQRDHVRIYGDDYFDRLRESGLTVYKENLLLQTIPSAAERLGLASSDLFLH